jgi:hypothetical protein
VPIAGECVIGWGMRYPSCLVLPAGDESVVVIVQTVHRIGVPHQGVPALHCAEVPQLDRPATGNCCPSSNTREMSLCPTGTLRRSIAECRLRYLSALPDISRSPSKWRQERPRSWPTSVLKHLPDLRAGGRGGGAHDQILVIACYDHHH